MKMQHISIAMAVLLGLSSGNLLAGQFNTRLRDNHLGHILAQHPNFSANRAVKSAGMAREAMEIKEAQEVLKARQALTIQGMAKGQSSSANHHWTSPLTQYKINRSGSTDSLLGNGTNGSGQHGLGDTNNAGSTPPPSAADRARACMQNPANCFKTGDNQATKYINPLNSVVTLKPVKPKDDNQDTTSSSDSSDSNKTGSQDDRPAEEGNTRMQEWNSEMKEHFADNGSPMIGIDGTFASGDTGTVTKSDKLTKDLTHTKDGNPGAGHSFVLSSGLNTRIKGCIPGSGPCKRQYTPSPFDKTSQPGKIESGTGSSGAPRLGNEAVSNPGDSTFIAHYQGGGTFHDPNLRPNYHGGGGGFAAPQRQ